MALTETWQDEADLQFIQQVQAEVTQSCALPFAVPLDRIPAFILQAAKFFWSECPYAFEERYYLIPNSAICRGNQFNKLIKLPPQILSVFGVYKAQQGLKYGAMGDFSLERMMLSSYSLTGGAALGAGVGNPMAAGGGAGFNLTDVVTTMYEVDTFNQTLNPPLTYNYNQFSNNLVLLGDMGWSDILICCCVRCKIQDLYKSYHFFRYVVALCKRSLSTIYGMFEFKLPGGVTINYSNLEDSAKEEIDEIKEWMANNQPSDYFFMPNTL